MERPGRDPSRAGRRPAPPHEPGGPDGPLERRPLEDRHLRLAGLVVLVFALGLQAGTQTIDTRDLRTGRVRATRTGCSTSSSSSRRPRSSYPERDADRLTTPPFQAAIDDTVDSLSANRRSPARPVAARAGERRPGLRGRPLGLCPVRVPRRPRRRRDKLGPIAAGVDDVQAAHPGLFVGRSATRAPTTGDRRRVRRRPQEGGHALGPDHAHHPRCRVRRARGRGHPAAARA